MAIDINKMSADELADLREKIMRRESEVAKEELSGAIDELRQAQERVNTLRLRCGMDVVDFPDVRRPLGFGKKKAK